MHTGIRRIGQRNCIYSALRQELMDTMFQDKVGSYDSSRYEVDLNKQHFAMVSDTGKVTAKAHLLASIAVEPPTLMWGYADELAQFGKAVELAHKVREYGLEHKENDLVSPEVEYTFPSDIDQQLVIASVAHDIGFAAITIFGTDYYYYSSPIRGGRRVVLLLENISEPVPPITLDYFYSRLPRYLQQVDDIAWSLEGFVELMPGWSIEMNDDNNGVHHARVTDDTGTSIRVSYQFDEYERLKRLEFNHD